jgi:hypothetical protein
LRRLRRQWHTHGARVADKLVAPTVLTDHATIRDRDVVDPLMRLPVPPEPALDDLNAIQIRTIRITQRANERVSGVSFREVTN